MKIWHVRSHDHRLTDESDESSTCEIYASSRDAVLTWIRAQIRQCLEQPAPNDDAQYPAVPIDDVTPVEVIIEAITLADLPHRARVLACLNRRGWAEKFERETLWFNRYGCIVRRPDV